MTQILPNFERPRERACKICGSVSPVLGSIDFNKKSPLWGEVTLPVSGHLIFYNQCSQCQFLFSSSLDKWSLDDFAHYIYNDDYALIDPEMFEIRPQQQADMLDSFCGHVKKDISIFDYGGGEGRFADILREKGYENVISYDPFFKNPHNPNHMDSIPEGFFDVVTCFETIEHVPNPLEVMTRLASLLSEDGFILIRTAVLPEDFEEKGLFWSYVMPRNGHISIFSSVSLNLVWNSLGLKNGSFDNSTHIAFKKIPKFWPHETCPIIG
jgi:2-polyprenyl-6-hydroxyphenyl methylase/3-demethylubiquinone-9 3-methyltransferase